jgi:hypothetical protein
LLLLLASRTLPRRGRGTPRTCGDRLDIRQLLSPSVPLDFDHADYLDRFLRR